MNLNSYSYSIPDKNLLKVDPRPRSNSYTIKQLEENIKNKLCDIKFCNCLLDKTPKVKVNFSK